MVDITTRGNRGARGVIFLAPSYDTPYRTVKITHDGTEYDVSDYTLNFNIRLYATNALPTAEITLDNGNRRYLNIFSAGDILEIWGDYTNGSTTKLFKGKINDPQYSLDTNGYTISIYGKSIPELSDQLIIESFTNSLGHTAIKTIIDNNYSGNVTYTNVTDLTVSITANYNNVSGWSAITDICKRCNADCYIDTDGDLHVFNRNSIKNNDVAIAIGINLKSVNRFGRDTDSLRNKIIIYGKEDSNVLFLKTEEDTSSQSDIWRKDEVISGTMLDSMDLVQEKADAVLVDRTSLPKIGSISALGLQLLNPGEKIDINVPESGITGTHRIQSVSHIWDNGGFYSNIQTYERVTSLAKLFKERIDAENLIKPFNNLNSMKDAYTITFTEDPTICYHTHTEDVKINGIGYLKLQSGETSGSVIIATHTADYNITECELRYKGNYPNTEDDIYYVSNGGDWERITPGTLHTFDSIGNKLKVSIELENANSTYETICILYK